jgi:hypothetical protein
MRAVISNSRSEPGAELKIAADERRDKMSVRGHIQASEEWMANRGKHGEEKLGNSTLGTRDQIVTDGIVEQTTPKTYPETPRKKIRNDMLTTPESKRQKRDNGVFPTPSTGYGGEEGIFGTPSTTRSKGGLMWGGNERSRHLLSPSATPTPTRFRDAAESARLTGEDTDHEITEQVIELLKDQSIEKDTSNAVYQLLNKYALRTQGIIKGRDITRVALKAKDGKIAELQHRIVALETEREMDKLLIKHLKSDMEAPPSSRNKS